MKKYIDAELLKENIEIIMNTKPNYTDEYDCGYKDCFEAVKTEISDVPAADVEEVKHGKWIDTPLNVYDDRYNMNKHNKRTKCSACDYAMPYEYPRFNICPCCGAKMDR